MDSLPSKSSDEYQLTNGDILAMLDSRSEAPFSFADRPIRNINPEVPVPLASVIDRVLQYDLESRHGSIEEFRDAILTAAITAKLDIDDPKSETTSRSYRFKPRHNTVRRYKTNVEKFDEKFIPLFS